MRDWFFYVVWFLRLKKIVSNLVREEGGEENVVNRMCREIIDIIKNNNNGGGGNGE